MAPPFSATRPAALFALLLLFFLTLPVTLFWVGNVSLEQAYRGISERAGAFDFIRREVFEEHSPVDILICGSSLLRSAVDPKMVEVELSRSLGRPAKVVSLPQSRQGPDMNYFVSRDFMERRPTKMLVIAAPSWVLRSAQPHVQLFRVVRYGDHPGALDGLNLFSRAAIYAGYVLGAPRQALSRLRPNRIDPKAGLSVEYAIREGYKGAPFVPRPTDLPPLDPNSLILSAQTEPSFQFAGPRLNDLQFHFIAKTLELARQHDALLVILHMPSPTERGQQIVPDREGMQRIVAGGAAFVGIPSARMFEATTPEYLLDYYQDEHLNVNGSILFTKAIAPALALLYERHANKN